ncbi:MAG: methionyl-tRNA formyltransferase [candidate division WWE3 bacterium]|nr:methionyl-tRNA formyltransferase [candidate division WWE3 bacterium]
MTSLVFFGSSKYAACCLDAIIKDGRYEVKLVVTQPDAPSGRNQEMTETAVSEFVRTLPNDPNIKSIDDSDNSEKFGLIRKISLLKPATLNDEAVIKNIKDAKPKVGIVLDYGLLIPADVMSLFDLGIINLHPSLLPSHRGAIPAQSAIICGDKTTGVTLIKINAKFDSGEVLAQVEEEIKNDDTPVTLYDRLFAKGITLLLAVLPKYISGEIKLTSQKPSTEPYEKRLTKDSGRIDWTQSDEVIERFIRGMTPWPGAWTTLQALHDSPSTDDNQKNDKTVKILKAHLNDSGTLAIDLLQIEGKNPMSWKQFEAGYLK